jgi:hypothetical protein
MSHFIVSELQREVIKRKFVAALQLKQQTFLFAFTSLCILSAAIMAATNVRINPELLKQLTRGEDGLMLYTPMNARKQLDNGFLLYKARVGIQDEAGAREHMAPEGSTGTREHMAPGAGAYVQPLTLKVRGWT